MTFIGRINDLDEPLEETAGGLACVSNSLTPIKLTLEPTGLPGNVTLRATMGGNRIRLWRNANGTAPVGLGEVWTQATMPPVLYVEGTNSSAGPRDVELTLTYDENPQGANNPLFKCSDKVRLTVAKINLITPAGDPVASPVDGGDGSGSVPDGANEFTFSAASSGVLTLKLKARVTPSGIADQIKGQVHFTVDGIGASTLAWNTPNLGGKPTASGDNLLATVTFTGLPAHNSDFGAKKAVIYFDGNKQDEGNYEVFFPKNETNHPGGQLGSPNWFHYWGQALNVVDVKYAPSSILYGEAPGMLHWSYVASRSKTVVIIYDLAATIDPGDPNSDHGQRQTTGIDTFEDTYLHEKHHVFQIAQADAVVGVVAGTPWRYGWAWNQKTSHNHWYIGTDGQPGVAGTDEDNDGTTDNYIVTGPGELGHGDYVLLDLGYDWPQAFGLLPQAPWAGGSPLEDPAYNREPDNENHRSSLDWGDPGKQHKTLNIYND